MRGGGRGAPPLPRPALPGRAARGSRELGLALAATLAHAESVAIRPDDDLLLPITSAPQPQLYRAATFRHAASSRRGTRLLAGLLQQLIDHWALLELEEREVLLEMMLPWLRARRPIGADDGGDGGETERMDDGRQRQTGRRRGAGRTRCSSVSRSAASPPPTRRAKGCHPRVTTRRPAETAWAALGRGPAPPSSPPRCASSSALTSRRRRSTTTTCGRKRRLCAAVLVLSRTQCHPARRRAHRPAGQYDATAPPADVPAHVGRVRAGRAVRREPLTATERSAFELCLALPYETAAMMLITRRSSSTPPPQPMAPTRGSTASTCRATPPPTAPSPSLLHALLLNLAPRRRRGQRQGLGGAPRALGAPRAAG